MIVTESWNANESLDAGDKKAMALKDRMGWLREWETAQRQQRQHVGGQSAGSDEGQSRAMHESPTESASLARPGNVPAEFAGVRRPAATVSDQATASRASTDRVGTVPRPEAAEVRVMGPVGAFQQTLDRAPSLSATSARCPGWFMRSANVWQPYVYQMVRTDRGVRVWIRDARIDVSSGNSILGALRSQLACVGMTLASVTINGKTVWEAPADGRCPESGSDTDSALLVNQLY